jgi:hypothetical protein
VAPRRCALSPAACVRRRRECDARVAAEVARQVDALRRVELGAARLEEEARCRAQLQVEHAQLDAATREAAARWGRGLAGWRAACLPA